jgi:hypothetical protein
MEEQRAHAADLLTVRDTDPVTAADLRALAQIASTPKVTIHLPTHRKGAEVRQDPVQLRNLVDDAAHQLAETGHGASVDAVLGPVRKLVNDTSFWQHQCDGLAVFASTDVHRWFRVPLELPASVTVGQSFHVAPLAPLLSGDGEFLVLTLSQNDVRLFAATRWTIRELDLGSTPTSMAEALAHEDPERQLQARSVGGGDAMYHGHGPGDHDKAAVERFIRAVDHGLHDLLGADPRPLVLACVGYYAPIFRSVTRHAHVIDALVEGNPEHLKPAELHAAAWACIAPRHAQADATAWSRYGEALGTGNTVENLDDACDRALEGRVDTLFVADHLDGVSPGESGDDRLDRAMLATLVASGSVVSVDAAQLPTGRPAVALLRY